MAHSSSCGYHDVVNEVNAINEKAGRQRRGKGGAVEAGRLTSVVEQDEMTERRRQDGRKIAGGVFMKLRNHRASIGDQVGCAVCKLQ